MEGNGPSFAGPLDSGRTNFAILVVGLGACDWETMTRRNLEKLGLAECFNLQPPNPLVIPPRRYDRLLPVNFRNPTLKLANPVMPKGFYKGALGSTMIWRTNWQLGQRSIIEIILHRPATRKSGVRTYIEVEVTSWFYADVGDYEMRLVVRVTGGKDAEELMDHLRVAREFCQTMLKALQAIPPSNSARKWRERQAKIA
jgi:hypothetical protein